MKTNNSNAILITNKPHRNFYHEITESLRECKSFYFSVAFITHAATQMILDELEYTNNHNVKGHIITTDYMLGTDYKALEILKRFDNIKTRIFLSNDKDNKGFHTKGYIFEYEDYYKIFIGSSNLSKPAITTNQEWNIKYISKEGPFVQDIKEEFFNLWDNYTIPLSEEFIKDYTKKVNKHNSIYDYKNIVEFIQGNISEDEYNNIARETNRTVEEVKQIINDLLNDDIKPNQMQEQALERLDNFRSDGKNKALVISATGTGKTYMSAFDVSNFNPSKMLFLVHNELILRDAINSFKKIVKDKTMGLYTGNIKDLDKDFIFSTVQMMSRDDNINIFDPNEFEYIILDEAHRSASPSYQKVLKYFNPKFLLGMTATPERSDSISIYDNFDNNVALEIRLKDAINNSYVVPFHYFGITDLSTDLKDIDIDNIDKLAKKLSVNARVDLIIENIDKYKASGGKLKALGFCVSIEHAKYMEEEFNKRGYDSISLTSLDTMSQREEAIKKLSDENNDLNFIFTVGIFNEGIDIPSINMALFLRPTSSPIVFTQQLGRGLRKYRNKDFLTVLDFIGNHNKSFMLPIALTGKSTLNKNELITITKNNMFGYTGDVFIKIEEKSIDQILKQLENENFNSLKYLKKIYFDTKQDLVNSGYLSANNVPSIHSFALSEFDPVRFIKYSKSYIEFVTRVEDKKKFKSFLNEENKLYFKYVESFLPLKRVQEYVIIKELLQKNEFNINSLYKDDLYNKHLIHALKNLNIEFTSSNNIKDEPRLLDYFDDGKVKITDNFKTIIKDERTFNYLKEVINYGIRRYEFNLKTIETDNSILVDNYFKYYEQYSREEVMLLARTIKKKGSVREGVWKEKNNYYLFVNMHKEGVPDSIDYKDVFIDRETFQWESQNMTSRNSKVGQELINFKEKNINIMLFVRKQDRENGKVLDFYYLGMIEDIINYEGDKPIKFLFKLRKKVPEDIYTLLTEKYN